jgi:hypothetical protein
LDSSSRKALQDVLRIVGFTLEIERILSITREIEIRNWVVWVGGVRRSFQTAPDEWPRRLDDGRHLILDIAGDLYSIADLEALDSHSRKLIWALID